jgi:hypothetical protein
MFRAIGDAAGAVDSSTRALGAAAASSGREAEPSTSGGRQGRAPWALVGTARRSCGRSHTMTIQEPVAARRGLAMPCHALPCHARRATSCSTWPQPRSLDLAGAAAARVRRRSRQALRVTASSRPAAGQQQAPPVGASKARDDPRRSEPDPSKPYTERPGAATHGRRSVALPRSEAAQRWQRWQRWAAVGHGAALAVSRRRPATERRGHGYVCHGSWLMADGTAALYRIPPVGR